jgi:hypothetical protein
MPTDLTFPPWVLWTAGALAAIAAAGFLAGTRRRRQPALRPTIRFQPLPAPPKAFAPPMASGRMPRPAAFMPAPAPLADSPAADDTEKRANYRRAGNPILVTVAAAGDHRNPWSAWVIDRSRQGVRLASERPMTVGETYDLRPVQAPPAAPWVTAAVRHCAQADGYWEAGCHFPQPPAMLVLMLFG